MLSAFAAGGFGHMFSIDNISELVITDVREVKKEQEKCKGFIFKICPVKWRQSFDAQDRTQTTMWLLSADILTNKYVSYWTQVGTAFYLR